MMKSYNYRGHLDFCLTSLKNIDSVYDRSMLQYDSLYYLLKIPKKFCLTEEREHLQKIMEGNKVTI